MTLEQKEEGKQREEVLQTDNLQYLVHISWFPFRLKESVRDSLLD
jgi:hypothetical protein